jgi:RNA polymerase sigma-70 factor, ECF subfamily
MRYRVRSRLTNQMTSSSRGRRGDGDEWALVEAACGGDERAFGLLLERYRPGLEEVCGLMLGDPEDAEDAMREAILAAWRERGLASASSSVRMWLYRITVRECMKSGGCGR